MLNVHARAPISGRGVLLVMMVLLVEMGRLSEQDAARAANVSQEVFDRLRPEIIETAQTMATDMLDANRKLMRQGQVGAGKE